MNHLTAAKKQQGATLLISLVLLLVLTILALAAGRSATLQQRMAGNLQQQNLAFQTAENGIQAAILQLQDESNRPPSGAPKYLFFAFDNSTSLPSSWAWANDCSAGSSSRYFCVEVEQVDCAASSTGGSLGSSSAASSIGVGSDINLTGGICYRITSTGQFESFTAVHQQGYMF
ncbi:hypothetical protein AXE65_08580 [Ventosimonas gracilis]|uniref:Type 4 fimbrial biogenesis protein PilX N-terminal domain-containing protein n=1 Tax=Ventosimonas gracilis TaxID=1680762 RepID=A0A139SYA9_9GAMM|nr:PilX N-terminal domain-containing pilus assembly protein [Ventosimonas gracilis]KXU39411.1 hypothetical protein AXE65_08580 [Ventosimonas gracilis]